MAEITKWKASQILPIIRHNMRNLEDGNGNGNSAIVPSITGQNYSLIDRGKTCREINHYRKSIENECFKYNRKNLVHALEVSIQCPSDCPPEQKDDFFRECYNYICSTLPMGERCVFVAQVHKDERYFTPDGEMISKDHLHIMYVPAVRDKVHDGYDYRLCADELTKRAKLREFHPALQKYLNDKGIHATVWQKKNGDGKTIGLSVKQLKELTETTGIKLDKSLTLKDLANVLTENQELKKELVQAQQKIKELDHQNNTEREIEI